MTKQKAEGIAILSISLLVFGVIMASSPNNPFRRKNNEPFVIESNQPIG